MPTRRVPQPLGRDADGRKARGLQEMLTPFTQPALAAFFMHTGIELQLIRRSVQESLLLLESRHLPPVRQWENSSRSRVTGRIFQVPELRWLCQPLCKSSCFVFREKMQKNWHIQTETPVSRRTTKSPGPFSLTEAVAH